MTSPVITVTTAITSSMRSLRPSARHCSGSTSRTAPVTMIAASVAAGRYWMRLHAFVCDVPRPLARNRERGRDLQ